MTCCTGTPGKIAIVILHCGGERMLSDCLRTLERQTWRDFSVTVVDNGSTDGSTDRVEAEHPWIRVLRTGKNLGWSGGNNVGIRDALQAGAEWVWLLNDDTLANADCLERMMEHAQEHPGEKVLSPVILDAPGYGRIDFQGGVVDFRNFEIRACESMDVFRQLAAPEYPFITGCAMLVHREVFERIGLIDERFFLYCEDSDFSLRAFRAGFGLGVVAEAKLGHCGAQTTGGNHLDSPFRNYHIFCSTWQFWRKHLGFWTFHVKFCGVFLYKRLVLYRSARDGNNRAALDDAMWDCLWGRRARGAPRPSPAWFRRLVDQRSWLLILLLGWDVRGVWAGFRKHHLRRKGA